MSSTENVRDFPLADEQKTDSSVRRSHSFLFVDILKGAIREKKIWLIPLITLLLVLVGLTVLATLAGPLAPFIYPLF